MTQRAGPPIALLCLVGALLLAAAGDRGAHPDRPPAAHTGGFGEPTCHACHFDFEQDRGPGRLALEGVPQPAEAGVSYEFAVVLQHHGMAAAGFQLTARFADGSAAGTLEATDDRVEMSVEGDVVYAHHSYAGSRPASADAARWSVRWLAPDSATGPVLFHATALAGDGDLSPLGDYVYALQVYTSFTGSR